MGRPRPLNVSLLVVQNQYSSDELMKNWVLMRYPSPSDYWTFRKTVSYVLTIIVTIQIICKLC